MKQIFFADRTERDFPIMFKQHVMENKTTTGECLLSDLSWEECCLIDALAINELQTIFKISEIGGYSNIGSGFDGENTLKMKLVQQKGDVGGPQLLCNRFYMLNRIESAEKPPLMDGYLRRRGGTSRGDTIRFVKESASKYRVLEYKKMVSTSTK